jgi:hypothetical protein
VKQFHQRGHVAGSSPKRVSESGECWGYPAAQRGRGPSPRRSSSRVSDQRTSVPNGRAGGSSALSTFDRGVGVPPLGGPDRLKPGLQPLNSPLTRHKLRRRRSFTTSRTFLTPGTPSFGARRQTIQMLGGYWSSKMAASLTINGRPAHGPSRTWSKHWSLLRHGCSICERSTIYRADPSGGAGSDKVYPSSPTD